MLYLVYAHERFLNKDSGMSYSTHDSGNSVHLSCLHNDRAFSVLKVVFSTFPQSLESGRQGLLVFLHKP